MATRQGQTEDYGYLPEGERTEWGTVRGLCPEKDTSSQGAMWVPNRQTTEQTVGGTPPTEGTPQLGQS